MKWWPQFVVSTLSLSSSSLPHHDHCDQLLWSCPGLWPVPELGLYTKSIIRPHSKLHIIKLTALIYILNLLPVKLSAFRYLRCQVLVFKSESFLCPIRNYETVIAIKKACMKVFKASIEHFLLWLVGVESSAGQPLAQKSQHLWLQ